MDNIEAAKSRLEVSGKFYLDPYSSYTYSGSTEYTNDLLDFKENYSSRLGLVIKSTSRPLSGRDAFFPQMENDSFFWGWGVERVGGEYEGTTVELV
jgi:hypothetical protein